MYLFLIKIKFYSYNKNKVIKLQDHDLNESIELGTQANLNKVTTILVNREG